MILRWMGLAAIVLTLILNLSATIRLLPGGSATYDRRQINVQIALIWLLPVAGALVVMYFLAEGRTPHRPVMLSDETTSDDWASAAPSWSVSGAARDWGADTGAGDDGAAGGSDGGGSD